MLPQGINFLDMACRKYRPSNGTEGMLFMEEFCEQCIHEKWTHTQDDNDKKCDILNRAFLCDINDPDYPTEWIEDELGARCTAYVNWNWRKDDDGNWNDPPPPEPYDPNQLCLPWLEMEIFEQTKEFKTIKELQHG